MPLTLPSYFGGWFSRNFPEVERKSIYFEKKQASGLIRDTFD